MTQISHDHDFDDNDDNEEENDNVICANNFATLVHAGNISFELS